MKLIRWNWFDKTSCDHGAKSFSFLFLEFWQYEDESDFFRLKFLQVFLPLSFFSVFQPEIKEICCEKHKYEDDWTI